jgi:PIN domain nuclease of toxin-antitoxin system
MGKRYLIDTHVLLWWIFDDPKLDQNIREIIQNPSNKIIVSSASAWEIATKYRIGKLPEAKELLEKYDQIIQKARFSQLSITTAHALRAGSLPIQHRDPFDRMIMAQSELEKIPVITYDPAFKIGLLEVIPE